MEYSSLCVNCKKPFTPRLKGFYRHRVQAVASPETLAAVFGKPATLFHFAAFICRPCHKILVAKTLPARPAMPRRKGCVRWRILKVPEPDVATVGTQSDSSTTPSANQKQCLTPGLLHCPPNTVGYQAPAVGTQSDSSTTPSGNQKQCLTPGLLRRPPNADGGKAPGDDTEGESSTTQSAKRRKLFQTIRLLYRARDTDSGRASKENTEGEPSSTPSAKRRKLFQTPGLHAPGTDGGTAPTENTKGKSPTTPSAKRRKQCLSPATLRRAPDTGYRRAPQTSLTNPLLENQEDADLQTNVLPSSRLPDGGEHSVSSELNDDLPPRSPECNARPKTPKEKAVEYIQESKYGTAFRQLCENYPPAKKALIAVALEMIRAEVKAMRRSHNSKNSFRQPVSVENVEGFRWEEVIDETQKVMPVAISCMSAMLPNVKRVKAITGRIKGQIGAKRRFTDDEAKAFINRRLGQMLAIGLFTQAPREFKFVQTCMGVELCRRGISFKLFRMLNHTGVTINKDSMRAYMDAFAEKNDQQVKVWKEKVEKLPTKSKARLKQRPAAPTFGLCVGYVQGGTESNYQAQTGGNQPTNKFFQQTMCYAARDRVQSRAFSPAVVDAETLDAFAFLPSPEVIARQRMRLVDVVASIMGRHMMFLEDLSLDLSITRKHEKSFAMSQKSEMVTLGTVNANPGTTQGMVTVLQHLQQYVPVTNGSPYQTLVGGDGSAIERILYAQRVKSNGENWKDRLDGFTPVPQEFHKEILLLQDSNNVFFRGESISAKGTITQLKQAFNHYCCRKEVMQNVQHTLDMYEFVTEGYTLLCALKFCGTSSLHEVPPSFPAGGNRREKLMWVYSVAQRVVDFVYHEPEKSSIQVAAEAYRENSGEDMEDALAYCYCRAEKDDEMVPCCSAACHRAWYHLSCVGLTAAPDDDWYCSADCRRSPSYIYCLCKMKVGPEGGTRMVQCALQGNCRGHEWYHYRCIGLQVTDVLPEKWYCSEACALESENDDHVLNHSKALTLEGLRHLARRAAVRAGNGPVMVEDWKIDLLKFWSRRHSKYLINAHHFLACVEGFAPKYLRTSLIWNRVINVNGKPDGNIGMDLGTQHINMDYKEAIKSSYGKVTDKHAEQSAKMCGPFVQNLEKMFSSTGTISMKTPLRKRSENVYKQEVASFVNDSQESALFDYLPFREHKGFENFDGKDVLRHPRKLGQKLRALSRGMDSQRRSVTSRTNIENSTE